MNTLEHAEKFIAETEVRIAEHESAAEEWIQRIETQVEQHRHTAEEQLQRIHEQQDKERHTAEERIQRLHHGLAEHQETVKEQIQRLQNELEEHQRTVAEQIERIHSEIQENSSNAEEQIKRIHSQIEEHQDTAARQVERIREQVGRYRETAEEHAERIRAELEEHKGTAEEHAERFRVETDTPEKEEESQEHTGQHPLQALMETFDAQYNQRHAGSTVAKSYVINGVEILAYSGKLLPLAEMDKKYPRQEWLQNLLDRNVTIGNFNEYWQYLSARDMLMRIEKKPSVWTSGAFRDSPHGENWETYQAAYINRLAKPGEPPDAWVPRLFEPAPGDDR